MVQGFTLQEQVAANTPLAAVAIVRELLIIARLTLGDAVLASETRYDERKPPVRNK